MTRPNIGTLALAFALGAAGCESDDTAGAVDTHVSTTTPADTQTADTATAPDTAPVADTSLDTTPPADTAPTPDTTPSPDTTPTPDTAPPADTTPPIPKEVRFIVMGDAGTGSDTQKKVAGVIKTKCAADGCDFVVMCGDNIYNVGVESTMDPQWDEKFEVPYDGLEFPFYAVLGNHDNGGFLSQLLGDAFGGAGGEFERGDYQVEYSKMDTWFTMPARSYDFEQGPAHFFMLDTNDMVWTPVNDGAATRTEAQKTSFPVLIDAATTTWKFVFGHHPYISNGQHGNAGSYEGIEEGIEDGVIDLLDGIGLGDLAEDVAAMATGDEVKPGLEAIVCDRADIYFSGHDHNRQWLKPVEACGKTTFVVSGAGAKTTDFKRDNPVEWQDDKKAGFFWLEVIDNKLFVEAINEDGVVEWTHEVTK